MRKLLVTATVVAAGMMGTTATAWAHTECDGELNGLTIGSLIVPREAVCKLNNVRVKGEVIVKRDAYFEASNSTITRSISAHKSQTVFLHDDTNVGGDVLGDRAAQFFAFDSKVGGTVEADGATDKVNICGMSVQLDVKVKDSGRDILVGDPFTEACAGNTVLRGDIEVLKNDTDVELVVRGNNVLRGNIAVSRNTGTSDKFVTNNYGGLTLTCRDNAAPFASGANRDWVSMKDQCGEPDFTKQS